jgi:hypothetical protein
MRCLAGLFVATIAPIGIAGVYVISGGMTIASESIDVPVAVAPSCTATSQFGKPLFANVRKVHFSGPAQPANSDGTFGGLTTGDDAGCSITIYEKFIVREVVGANGVGYRDVYAYDKLANFEQAIRP